MALFLSAPSGRATDSISIASPMGTMRKAPIGIALLLSPLAFGCATFRAEGQRNALEAARVEWLRRGQPTNDCEPRIQPLSSYAYEASCGSTVTYVRCDNSSSGTCCSTMKDRAAATESLHVLKLQDSPASQVCQ
jgi:hypothetical protein